MFIQDYDFGKIKVDGTLYEQDLILYPDRVKENWWRKEGHKLQKEDLDDIMEANPDILVVGTGYSGMVKITQPVKNLLREKGIQLEAHKSGPATVRFNQLTEENPGKKVVGAFHLTC